MASRGYSKRMLGSTRMPMRNVGGVKAPSFGINTKVTGLASTNRDEGTVGKGGVEVGGLPAGKSLARPGRKAFKDGGSVLGEYGGMRERTAAERMKDWDRHTPVHQTSLAQHKATGGGVFTDLDGRDHDSKRHHASGKQMVGLSHSTPEQPIPKPERGGRGRAAIEAPLPEGADSDRGQYYKGGVTHRHKDDDDKDDDGYKHGGRLTAAARDKIATKNFAGPDRSYPIQNASHARNALARVSQHGSPALQERVKAAVHKKYPGIGSGD